MPAQEITKDEIVEALEALDTPAIQAVAAELGFGERTLWRYRSGSTIPTARLRPLARALGLTPRSAPRGT